MSSYFVNPLYSKYKVAAAAAAAAAAGEAINSPYYDCHFAPEIISPKYENLHKSLENELARASKSTFPSAF
ncbi:hypothetical protein HGM15179_000002 [Zosterops borbonicus]|uniref:Uncharacterized protein n=1 Tax=Zosterops borbonicus TaxID=364589 RepID=A0A8K1LUV5_9PASS|nr:hypothetical protein HGM15179_000002 [Zosterops borbonicus]